VTRPALAPLAYALLLAVMAAAQLSDVPAFYDVLRTYGLPDVPARGLAVAGILGEGGAAAGLVLAILRPSLRLGTAAGALGTAVAAGWLVLAVQALLRGLDVPNAGYLGPHAALELQAWLLVPLAAGCALALYAWRSAVRSEARALARAS
jgi:hypothetical protein